MLLQMRSLCQDPEGRAVFPPNYSFNFVSEVEKVLFCRINELDASLKVTQVHKVNPCAKSFAIYSLDK